jgi:hypothetical protein
LAAAAVQGDMSGECAASPCTPHRGWHHLVGCAPVGPRCKSTIAMSIHHDEQQTS